MELGRDDFPGQDHRHGKVAKPGSGAFLSAYAAHFTIEESFRGAAAQGSQISKRRMAVLNRGVGFLCVLEGHAEIHGGQTGHGEGDDGGGKGPLRVGGVIHRVEPRAAVFPD